MEKKQSIKKKRNRIVILFAFLTALVLSCTGLQGELEEFHAACKCSSSSCSTCGGDGTYYVCGNGQKCSYSSPSTASHKCPNSGNNYATTNAVTHYVSCTWPGSYTTSGTTRYKNCTKCGGRLHTQYYLSIEAGTGIKSTSGSGWYDSGTTGINVSCTVKTGYTFSKWSDGDTRQSWSMASKMDQAKTFTAYATANKYTVTFNANSGSVSTASMSVTFDSTYGTLPTPTRTGYTFDGWYTAASGGTRIQSTNTVSTANNHTLYAHWTANKIKITLDKNGGSGGTSNFWYKYGTGTYYSNSDCTTTLSAITNPTRTGYTFTGYTGDGTCGGTNGEHYVAYNNIAFASDLDDDIYKDATLYAQWTPNTYTLTISPNGGTFSDGKTEAVTTDPKLTYNAMSWWNVGSYVPTRTGYTFEGFYNALEGGTKVYDETGACVTGTSYWTSDKKYCHAGNLAVYARWKENEYTVTYDANGGTTETSTKTFHYGDEVDLTPTAQKDGKIFVGWSTDKNASAALNTLVMPDLATSENAEHEDWELTLYAVYSVAVSDVANHTYPAYDSEKGKKQEVFLRVYDPDNLDHYMDYELTYEQDTNTMVYRYVLDVNIADFVGSMEKYYYIIYAYDNAENWNKIYENWVYRPDEPIPPDEPEPPAPEPEDPTIPKYRQTVEHYRYDAIEKKWKKCYSDTQTDVEENTVFTPSHLTPPTGYHKAHIEYPQGYEDAGKITDGSYVVTEDAVSRVYYEPNMYTITFYANGGRMDVNGSVVTKAAGTLFFGDRYGNVSFDTSSGFTTPERKGYTFEGWYTKATGGEVIEGSEVYETDGNTTLYAHWSINQYTVTYDYWTNKGTGASVYQKSYDYQTEVDLSVSAQKSDANLIGWKHIGWNTDADATTGLTNLVILDKDVVLYAIYQKDISVTQVDQTNSGTKTTVQTKRIYNKADAAEFILKMAAGNTWTGWEHLGWTTETGAEELPLVGPGGTYRISENTTVYSVYESSVTLSHDTNGSTMLYEPQTKACYYNAAGNSSYPFFTAASAPVLSRHSFVRWNIIAGTVIDADANQPTFCMPADVIQLQTDATLEAVWDKHPVIEAYNRHFTLEEAKNGEITPEELLEKVIATDEEAKSASNPDGVLENGVDVVVKNYNASDFTGITGDKTISITYEATDSFGNVVTKTVSITITDTTMKKSNKKTYVRFISKDFLADEDGELLSSEQGGLEETSIWRTNEHYNTLLRKTVFNEKTNGRENETWVFTYEDIKEMKTYTHTYGKVWNAFEKFFELFDRCKCD